MSTSVERLFKMHKSKSIFNRFFSSSLRWFYGLTGWVYIVEWIRTGIDKKMAHTIVMNPNIYTPYNNACPALVLFLHLSHSFHGTHSFLREQINDNNCAFYTDDSEASSFYICVTCMYWWHSYIQCHKSHQENNKKKKGIFKKVQNEISI